MKRQWNPQTAKIVFFDMNNTLIDPKSSFDSCFLSVLVDFTGRWDHSEGDWNPQRVLDTYRSAWTKKAKLLARKPRELEEAKKQCLEAALHRYPFQVNDAFVSSFFREMKRQVRAHAVPFPDAGGTLAALSETHTIGIITNGSKEHQRKVIARLNWSSYIRSEHLISSDQAGSRKPDPAIFRLAVRSAAIRPQEGVMVGDSWKNDIEGAVKSGMNAVWLNRSETKKSSRQAGNVNVPVVRSLTELKERLTGK
ncbi:MAG: family hydrolase [Paenibacillus sp.]|jgi:putative hydrolase of the HAD superfamily|uniref:HAD family hydrolase n=1 Tax=Paenibacillus sp. GCM10012303 TaxID=3317340 RepID=UPI0029F1A77D|nr:family hydrolase [Paenibacillus sp.]